MAGYHAANAELALRFAEPPFAALPAALPPAPPDGTNGSNGGGGSVAPAPQAAGAAASPVTASALAMATYHGSFAADRGSGFAAGFAQGVLLPLDAFAAEVEQVSLGRSVGDGCAKPGAKPCACVWPQKAHTPRRLATRPAYINKHTLTCSGGHNTTWGSIYTRLAFSKPYIAGE